MKCHGPAWVRQAIVSRFSAFSTLHLPQLFGGDCRFAARGCDFTARSCQCLAMFGTVFSAPLNRNFDAEVLGFFLGTSQFLSPSRLLSCQNQWRCFQCPPDSRTSGKFAVLMSFSFCFSRRWAQSFSGIFFKAQISVSTST